MIKGKIIQVSGPVVDCLFPEGQLPRLREALSVKVNDEVRYMEVAQLLGDSQVRCIILSQSEGLARDMEVIGKGTGIMVPVGDVTIGRMFNVLGQPIDGGKPIPKKAERWPIHRKAPAFDFSAERVSVKPF